MPDLDLAAVLVGAAAASSWGVATTPSRGNSCRRQRGRPGQRWRRGESAGLRARAAAWFSYIVGGLGSRGEIDVSQPAIRDWASSGSTSRSGGVAVPESATLVATSPGHHPRPWMAAAVPPRRPHHLRLGIATPRSAVSADPLRARTPKIASATTHRVASNGAGVTDRPEARCSRIWRVVIDEAVKSLPLGDPARLGLPDVRPHGQLEQLTPRIGRTTAQPRPYARER